MIKTIGELKNSEWFFFNGNRYMRGNKIGIHWAIPCFNFDSMVIEMLDESVKVVPFFTPTLKFNYGE